MLIFFLWLFFILTNTFSRMQLRSNLAIINWPEQTNWYTNSLSSSRMCGVKSGALPEKKYNYWTIELFSYFKNVIICDKTYVRSLTTRTSSENDSLAAFCFVSLIWQQNSEYRCVSFSIKSNGVMNVRNVVMNASPNAEIMEKNTIIIGNVNFKNESRTKILN